MDRIHSPVTFEQFLAIQQLYAEYASAVDARDWERWVEMFTDDCVYRLQPRENHERGFPLATLSLESRGALKDRAYGIQETLFHDPYYQRHVLSAPIVRAAQGGVFDCETNYAVFRTKLSQLSTVFNVGRSIDRIISTEAGLKFQSRLVVYDSEMIPNTIIYPL